MRVTFVLPVVAALTLSACENPLIGDNDQVRGTAAQLTYAAPGTQIRLLNSANGKTTETRITAGAPTGLRGAYTTDDGRFGSFYPGCWGCGDGMTIEEEKYARLWPLEIGKQVVFLRTAADGQKARMVIRVAGTETVETASGTYQAYLLDGRIENITGPRYSAQVRAWWAPGPGWVVKAEGGDSQGNTLSSQVAGLILP
ncbi:MAG: hypothetical protein AAF557_20545 [Pseudomonadota bacterium]